VRPGTGVAHFSPHDLRHRGITLWHQSGVPARELAERAGHARPSMSLDVYSHVMPPDELVTERLSGAERRLERCPGGLGGLSSPRRPQPRTSTRTCTCSC